MNIPELIIKTTSLLGMDIFLVKDTKRKFPLVQVLEGFTNTNDWCEIIQQLYAQMMGWA